MRIILKIFEKFFVMCGVAAVALFFLVILTGIYHNRADILSYFLEKPKFSPTLIPTKYPTLQPTITQIVQNNVQGVQTQIISNQIDCIGPDNKQFKTTMKECEDLNRKYGNKHLCSACRKKRIRRTLYNDLGNLQHNNRRNSIYRDD